MLTDEQAKAVQEVAKTTGKALDLVGGAGTFLVNSTVGRITSAVLRVAGGDWVCAVADRNLAGITAKTAKILDGIAQERLSEPSPSVVKPLLEAAADESREELQDLWAALLANAMVDGGQKVRRDYFDAVRQMEPQDALMLDLIVKGNWESKRLWDDVCLELDGTLTSAECFVSLSNLERLGCVEDSGDDLQPAPFGICLLEACRPPENS